MSKLPHGFPQIFATDSPYAMEEPIKFWRRRYTYSLWGSHIKSYERILMNVSGNVQKGAQSKWLDFGNDGTLIYLFISLSNCLAEVCALRVLSSYFGIHLCKALASDKPIFVPEMCHVHQHLVCQPNIILTRSVVAIWKRISVFVTYCPQNYLVVFQK